MIKYLIVFLFITLSNISYALDSNGNFESARERDEFLVKTLNDMSQQINQQTPIMLDEYTKFMGAISLNKTMTFMYQIVDIDARNISYEHKQLLINERKEVLNDLACANNATLALLALGVEYVFLYSDENGRNIARISLKNAHCS